MQKLLLLFIPIFILISIQVSAAAPSLKDAFPNAGKIAGDAGYNQNTNLEGYLAKSINIILSVLGLFFLILMIYAGFLWMNAQGKQDQVEKARNIIQAAIIGLVIVVSAYVITYFVVQKATEGVLQ